MLLCMGAAQTKSPASVAPMGADGQDMVHYIVSQEEPTPGGVAMHIALPGSRVTYHSWYVSEPPPPSLAPPGPPRAYNRRLLNVKMVGTFEGDLQITATSADTGSLATSLRRGEGPPVRNFRVAITIDGDTYQWQGAGLGNNLAARGRRYRLLCFRKDGETHKEELVAALADSGPSGGVLSVAATFAPPEVYGGRNAQRRFAELASCAIAARQLGILNAWRWQIEERIRRKYQHH